MERKHRHILEVDCALRFQASLPIEFWGDCVQAMVFLMNQTPTMLLYGKSPYEVTPIHTHLYVLGSLCYVCNKPRHKDKFVPRSLKCVLLGYYVGQKD